MITAKFEKEKYYITRHVTHFKKISPTTGLTEKDNSSDSQKQLPKRKQYSLRKRK